MKCIDDEIPFEIPEGWEWTRMGNIGDWGSGSTPQRGNSSYYGGSIPWLKTGELNDGVVYDTAEKITDKALKECSLRLNKIGDILIAMYGATIGKVAIAGIDLTTNQACCGCTPIIVYNEYLFYFLMASKVDFVKKGEGGAQPNISREKLVSHLMPIPPIDEQQRIVLAIKHILPYVTKYTRHQTELDRLNASIKPSLKKSILQEAIQGKLVPQDPNDEPASVLLERIREEKAKLFKEGKLKKKDLVDSVIFKGEDNKYYEQIGKEVVDISEDIPFEIPESWSWSRLSNICSICTGATFKKEDATQNQSGVRILRGGNILPFRIYIKDDDIFIPRDAVKDNILLRQNDIVTPAVTSLENIGKMARIKSDMLTTTVGGFVFILRPYLNDDILSEYLLSAMSAPATVEFMRSITNKSGQAFYNIGKERLSTTLLPVPPHVEQMRIIENIQYLFSKLS